MKILLLLSFLIFGNLFADVISCGDAFALKDGSEAKYELHKVAQQRAQRTAEDFMGKKMTNPFPQMLFPNKKGDPKDMIQTIEVFWCENAKTPLHQAYYSFYMNNKTCWE